MTRTEDDQHDNTTREQKLRDLLTIRSYLRDRRDDLSITPTEAKAFAWEVERLSEAITKAEAEAAQ
jgi:hypothetical protein